MNEYIERDKFLEAVGERNQNSYDGKLTYQQLKEMVENFPTADVIAASEKGKIMEKLKPCPFCGSDKVAVQYLYFRPYIICKKCHAQIPCYNTYPRAREAWNRRVDSK